MKKYSPPKWKYHAEKDAVQVHDEVEESKLGLGWSDSYIEKKYPKHKYRPAKDKDGNPTFETKVAVSAEAEAKLGSGWHDSPAGFGIETTPGREPDAEIAKVAERATPPKLSAKLASAKADG